MLHTIKSYLKFLWNSKNEHAVHSPFVFHLLTKCFYDRKPKPEYLILKKYRKSLLENKNFIEVTDFGAGSKVFKSNSRQISKIAQTAGISPKRAELLFRVTNYFKPKNVLEIGTSLGLASSAITLGSKESFLLSLEGCQNTQSVAENLFNQQFPDFNFDFVNSEFGKFLKEGSANICDWDLIYFDGNHSKKATLEYFNLLLPTINNDSVWIFDDIHWSEEMEEAWGIIQNHPKVKVTIDTFQWGFVFFRYEQEKEHFVIRV
ncbi:class I SAM-dependent methyltransferase [Flavobacterium tructae]|uniref:class I SAM-dependent methyltransferase n=1 Tax=Flavobacterium tructae TaxID=1114873 RepID=UPI002551E17E|nr:class I SAM-dependent methyltransferase [Flavobacterium tructae]MDL2143064.1 class I SAM-dependent methyltransferase [Flavobacterium tructae]